MSLYAKKSLWQLYLHILLETCLAYRLYEQAISTKAAHWNAFEYSRSLSAFRDHFFWSRMCSSKQNAYQEMRRCKNPRLQQKHRSSLWFIHRSLNERLSAWHECWHVSVTFLSRILLRLYSELLLNALIPVRPSHQKRGKPVLRNSSRWSEGREGGWIGVCLLAPQKTQLIPYVLCCTQMDSDFPFHQHLLRLAEFSRTYLSHSLSMCFELSISSLSCHEFLLSQLTQFVERRAKTRTFFFVTFEAFIIVKSA